MPCDPSDPTGARIISVKSVKSVKSVETRKGLRKPVERKNASGIYKWRILHIAGGAVRSFFRYDWWRS